MIVKLFAASASKPERAAALVEEQIEAYLHDGNVRVLDTQLSTTAVYSDEFRRTAGHHTCTVLMHCEEIYGLANTNEENDEL